MDTQKHMRDVIGKNFKKYYPLELWDLNSQLFLLYITSFTLDH